MLHSHLRDCLDTLNRVLLKNEAKDKEIERLKSDNIAKTLCISYLSSGVAKLWDSVTSGMHNGRSLVGDTMLDMQESLMDIGIDARGKAALNKGE